MGSKHKKAKKIGAGDSAGDSENGKKKEKTVIDDPRFSIVHSDPRFRKVLKRTAKVSIDSRFNDMFTDKRFVSSSAKVDKRGKLKKQTENALRRYYHLEKEDKEEDEAKEKNKKKKKKSVKKVEEESEGDSSESPVSESSSESSGSESEPDMDSDDSSSTTDSDDDEADGADMLEDDDSVEVENVPVIDKETHRLAAVNMDWTQVKAVDLFMMLRSFLPKGGQIKSVAVYPSEFGLKSMAEEAVRGPVALLEGEKKKEDGVDEEAEEDDDDSVDEEEEEGEEEEEDDDDSVDEEEEEEEEEDDGVDDEEEEEEDDGVDDEEEEGDVDGVDNKVDDDDEIDTEKLRAYEKSRLRYYYAVVECDSVATADYLYKACDGVEFERSSNVLDLRFIPDSMEFLHPPRDVAKEAPSDYEGLDFHTRALQQSNITLSWDDDEPHRVKTLRRKLNEEQLAELELKEFLASDESDSDEDEVRKTKMDKKVMYRALLQSGDGSEEDEDEGQDMEVTFNTGLEDLSKKILEKKDKRSETVWEASLRKMNEKKKAKKYRSKNSSDDESDGSDQKPLKQRDDFFEEPSVVRNKKATHGKKKREEKRPLGDEETAATAAELELLLADEKGGDNNLKGYKIKQKKGKGKKGKEAPEEDKLPTVDYDDPRFSALFSRPEFALDPTDPQFKRSATYFRQLAQRKQNDREGNAAIEPPVEPSIPRSKDSVREDDENAVGTSRKENLELLSIVKSIKMKSQQLAKPSSVKMKKDKMEHGSTVKGKKHKLDGLDRKMNKKAKV